MVTGVLKSTTSALLSGFSVTAGTVGLDVVTNGSAGGMVVLDVVTIGSTCGTVVLAVVTIGSAGGTVVLAVVTIGSVTKGVVGVSVKCSVSGIVNVVVLVRWCFSVS